MIGPLLGLLALALLSATGILVALVLRIRRPTELLLAVYVVASAVLVGLFLFLSAFGAVSRGALVAGLATLCIAAFAVWVLAGAPRGPSLSRHPFRDPGEPGPLLICAVAVVIGLAYIVALIVGTPPNGWDPANYHLARAAFWLQSHGVGYIRDAYDQRLNFNPPNGEIGFAFVLGITRDENLVGFVQFFAALAAATGALVLARRLGLSRAEAAFGALVFLSLPLVALQATGAKNDLIVAAYLVAAAVFLLGDSRRELALGSVATALAMGTKFTAAYGLAVLLVLVLVVRRRRNDRLVRLAALMVGAVVGSYWYVVNFHETGRFLGDQSNVPGLTAPLHPPENLLTAFGTLVDTLDLSGARGADIFLYLIVALAVALTLRGSGWRLRAAVVTVAGAAPLALLVISRHLGHLGLVRLYDALGHPKGYIAPSDSPATSPTSASDTISWYGPLGLLLVIGAAGAALRRRFLSLGVVAALAPAAYFVLVALTLTYNPWLGRFFVFPIALSASMWGLALRSRDSAWTVATLASVTLVLSLVHFVEKPSGLRLLDRGATEASVWTMERWQVQSQHDPTIGPVFRYLDHDVPRHASIALALGANNFGYPAFGPHLDRRVELVPFASSATRVHTAWLLANRERATEIDPRCWHAAFRSDEGTVFRNTGGCG